MVLINLDNDYFLKKISKNLIKLNAHIEENFRHFFKTLNNIHYFHKNTLVILFVDNTNLVQKHFLLILHTLQH